jgi:hypothetical protein
LRALRTLCLLLGASGIMWAQDGSQNSDSLRNDPDIAAEVKALRAALSQTQKQLAAQQQEIEALKGRVRAEEAAASGKEQPPSVVDTVIRTATPSALGSSGSMGANSVNQPVPQQEEKEKEKKPALGSFNIGDAVFTPGGFVDLENIFRTTNTQNNTATNYAAIPYSNTPQGHLSEYRLTAQFSRFNLKGPR